MCILQFRCRVRHNNVKKRKKTNGRRNMMEINGAAENDGKQRAQKYDQIKTNEEKNHHESCVYGMRCQTRPGKHTKPENAITPANFILFFFFILT